MDRPRLLSRENLARDLRTAVVTVLVSSVVVATPSVAARIKNADKVDGKHAVGAAAPVAVRKRKLVATNGQGRLPDDIIARAPDADRLDGLDGTAFARTAARPGEVLTGHFGAGGGGNGSSVMDVQVFGGALPVAVPPARVTVLAPGAPVTAQCPGPGEVVPRAWLCVYSAGRADVLGLDVFDPATGITGTSRDGFGVFGYCDDSLCFQYGSWAVRAGTASDVPARAGARRPVPLPTG